MSKISVFNADGDNITDDLADEDWIKELLELALKNISHDEIDTEMERLLKEGKQVLYCSDTVH